MAEIKYTDTIVSDTDKKGNITFANDVFQKVAGYSEAELLGANHNIVRHEDMPRACFKLVWDTLKSGKSLRAYVINKAKNGDYYWVLGTFTITDDGYHAERIPPNPAVIKDVIAPLYKQMRDKEKEMNYSNEGMDAALQIVLDLLAEKGITYDELIDSLDDM